MDNLFTTIMSIDDFEKASDDVLEDFFPGGKEYTDTIQAARKEFKSLIFKNNFDVLKVKEALRSKEGDTDRVETFINKFMKRKTLLLYSILIENNTPYGDCVKEYDWVLKLITGTDGMKSARKPIVQLQLTTVDAPGTEKKNVYDMQKDVLSKFITGLGNVCLGKQ